MSWWVLVSLACPVVFVLAEFGIRLRTPWVSGLALVIGMLAGALAWLRSRRMRWLSALGMALNTAPWVIFGLYVVGLWRPT